MTSSPRFATVFGVLATVVLSAAVAAPQDLATAEEEAFAAVSRAIASLERAADRSALIRAAAQVATAADHARNAFAAADHARDTAAEKYHAAYKAALAGAVTCGNGYPCTNKRLDRFAGIADALIRHLQLIASVSFAAAKYVEAVGIAGGAEARARGTRIRRLAARLRNVQAAEAMDRWNGLVGGVLDESDATSELHGTATEARAAARRALSDDVNQVLEVIAAAATRAPPDAASRAVLDAARGSAEALRSSLAEVENPGYRPAVVTDADAGVADSPAGAPEPSVVEERRASPAAPPIPDRTFETAAVADASEVAARPPDAEPEAAEAADVADALAALDRAFAADAPAANVPEEEDVARPADADAEPEAAEAADVADALAALDRAFAADAPTANVPEQEAAADAEPPALADEAVADVAGEPEPTDLTAWVRAVNAGVRRAEEVAAEAEEAAADTGRSWFSRTVACVDARDRLSRAWERVKELTIGEARPAFVTSTAGSEAYCEVEDRLEAAHERGRLACDSIEQPR